MIETAALVRHGRRYGGMTPPDAVNSSGNESTVRCIYYMCTNVIFLALSGTIWGREVGNCGIRSDTSLH